MNREAATAKHASSCEGTKWIRLDWQLLDVAVWDTDTCTDWRNSIVRGGHDSTSLARAIRFLPMPSHSLHKQKNVFGQKPAVVGSLEELSEVGVDAVDVTTTPPYHHTVAVETLERGWHTMVEKPMGLTVRACNLIRSAAEASDAILSVAEKLSARPD